MRALVHRYLLLGALPLTLRPTPLPAARRYAADSAAYTSTCCSALCRRHRGPLRYLLLGTAPPALRP